MTRAVKGEFDTLRADDTRLVFSSPLIEKDQDEARSLGLSEGDSDKEEDSNNVTIMHLHVVSPEAGV